MKNFAETIFSAKENEKMTAAERRANLNAVSNAAKRAFPDLPANKAIAKYCGVNYENLRSFEQLKKMGVSIEVKNTLPRVDVWGSNSEKWIETHPAAPKFFPRSAWDCSALLEPAAAGGDVIGAAYKGMKNAAEEVTKKAARKTRKAAKKAETEDVASVDDLPF